MNTISPAAEAATTESAATGSALRRPMIGVLARAEAAELEAKARITELEAEVRQLRTEQITDGSDPRLEEFWEKAGRIADYADFCEEYDRMANAMNGPARVREYDVEMTISVSITHTVTVSATSEEDAEEVAEQNLEESDFDSSLSIDGWEVTRASASRA